MSIAPNGEGFILDCDGMAVPAADVLSDFFAEHSDDPDEGPPEDWPAWTDEITLELGPGLPLTDAEDLQVERTPWHDWLATPAEPQP